MPKIRIARARSAFDSIQMLERELADTNREVMQLTLELDRKIAQLNEAQGALYRSLLEKTALLQEVHHRVNNNLQVVCSLLSMQMARASDPEADDLRTAYTRVFSMSLVHQRPYRSDSLSHLELGDYIRDLASHLVHLYCEGKKGITLRLEAEPVTLSPDQAIPCGLVLNELLSNSLLHGFPDGRTGTVRVGLRQVENKVELTVGDDGAGSPAANGDALGQLVVRTLLAQLRAELESVEADGLRLHIIRFQPVDGNAAER